MHTKKKLDIVNGPMFSNVIRYILPLIASGYLGHLYHTADTAVIGQFEGPIALAAMGATSSLYALIVTMCSGFATGVNVAAAQNYGAKDTDGIHKLLHTSVLISFFGGLFVAVFGFSLTPLFLTLLDTPADVFPYAVTYLRICFLGVPASMIYGFTAALLRAIGNTRTPLLFGSVSGLLNVILNLVFVCLFHLGIAGVAWATVISQYVSMGMILIYLVRLKDCCHLDFRKLKVYKDEFIRIIRISIPPTISAIIYSMTKVVIQSALNSFDNAYVIAGSAAAREIDNYIYTAMISLSQAAMTFTGQMVGAKKVQRLHKVMLTCSATVMIIGLITGTIAMVFAEPLLSIYVKDSPETVRYAIDCMSIVATSYFIYGTMEVLVGCQQGMGSSFIPSVVSLIGGCGMRFFWVYAVFYAVPSVISLYLAYPVSWLITGAAQFVFYIRTHKQFVRRFSESTQAAVTQ